MNLMFVLCLVGIIYAFMKAPIRVSRQTKGRTALSAYPLPEKSVLSDVFGVFLGIFIYKLLGLSHLLRSDYGGCRIPQSEEGQFAPGVYAIGRSLLHGAWMLIISELVALPFTLQFKSMVSGIALAENHTSFKQLLVCVGISADSVHCFL